ncbi:MAG: GT-D fold domain-containing glycosyltransferase [Butyrivibrio sp.]|nr:GT-D fold domain-containing glycosyltransferase [Butyrivibrio sp.]
MEQEQILVNLLNIVEDLQKKVRRLEQDNAAIVRAHGQLLEYVQMNQSDAENFRDNVIFELTDNSELARTYFFPKIMSGQEAIERIVNEGCSMARFGDGEFSVIAGRIRHRFQTVEDERLASRLREVLNSDDGRLLIGLANNYGSLDKYTEQAKREIRSYMRPEIRKEHMLLLNTDKQYYDAYVTRPYVMYADNKTDAPAKRFEQLKRIWDKRKCVFVEGSCTGLGVGNDLFDNAAKIHRILGPVQDAFLAYDKILECCTEQDKDSLFLLALGPTATVLAYDLCRAGYQAVDVGHVDLEYEWFLAGEGRRTEVGGKYNNELPGGQEPLPLDSPEYKAQIIADFS